MPAYVEPSDPIVREALTQRAVGIAHDALTPILDGAVERGLSRDEVLEVATRAIEDGGTAPTLERIAAALDEAIDEGGEH